MQLQWPHVVDLLALHRRDPARYPFLLESVASGGGGARHDLLLAFPQQHLQLKDTRLSGDGVTADAGEDFFDALDCWARQHPAAPSDLPFCGGWFLYLGYESAGSVEPRLHLPASPHRLPDALAVRCPAAVLVDRVSGTCTLVAETPEFLQALQADCAYLDGAATAAVDAPAARTIEVTEADPSHFLGGVRRILDYLRAGDIFQANLSRAWHGTLPVGEDYLSLYLRLRQTNPAPFAGLAWWQGSAVLSSSPERLLAIQNGVAQTRPIAGTHARVADALQDSGQRQRLIGDLKERAEHLMLIDLERNDLGRVCMSGSVEVDELMVLESYRHVHHIVSNVRGRLRAGVGPGEALRAVFPGGTITGCPKVRAMQIIAELEGEGRGPYTGAMGYLSRCGRLDSNILIRSLICEDGRFTLRAGAGIVSDSDPQTELAETRAKARGLLQALTGDRLDQ